MHTAPILQMLPPEIAWEPLPHRSVDSEVAAHLLRRMGFSVAPDEVKKTLNYGLEKTIQRAFAGGASFEKSEALVAFESTAHERYREAKEIDDPDLRRDHYRDLRQEEQRCFNEYAVQWFDYARQTENSAREKFVLFLQDVFVVARQTVKDVPILFDLQQTLRKGIHQTYPELCKAVSREPAMIRYLDLAKNTNKKPNENFARELFELFTLGEGNGYTENDIKEAARAFTGYRIRERYDYFLGKYAHDEGQKTVFGQTGNWDGDDVIDLTFQQPAAKTFLIEEFLKYYLSIELPDKAYIEALGDAWAANNFQVDFLIETIFQSRLFHHPYYRGNSIKSPTHFYLGLCQDLQLDVIPFESRLLRSMSAMGQAYFDPPNVRGWLYGPNWINSTTISARRQLVDYLFTPLNKEQLNGNDQKTLEAVQAEGKGKFLVTEERLSQLDQMAPSEIAEHLTTYFITGPSRSSYQSKLTQLLEDPSLGDTQRVRIAVIGLLQSPAYNLC